MPTFITHALVGASLVQAAPSPPSKWKTGLAMAMVAALPDLDVIGFAYGIPYWHPLGHRGFSHSLVFSFILGFLVCIIFFKQPRRLSIKWFCLFALFFIAGASHGLLDAATDAGLGVGLFIPFDPTRFFFDFRPIRTSPLNPALFFRRRTLVILQSEILWVWLPIFGASLVFQMGRLVTRLISRPSPWINDSIRREP